MRLYTFLKALAALKRAPYPVGAIYISAVPVNPGELFGGTWLQIAQGRVLMGQGSVDPNTTDQFGVTANDAYSLGAGTLTSPARGGTPDQINVEHAHLQDPHKHMVNDHVHVMNSHTHTQTSHSHKAATKDYFSVFSGTHKTDQVGAISGSGYDVPKTKHGDVSGWGYSDVTELATPEINSAVTSMEPAGAGYTQDAAATVQSAGTNGTNKNLPPFEVVYYYKRVA